MAAVENFHLLTMSVANFCETASTLLDDDLHLDFVSFVLSGEYDGNQVVVDPILNRLDEDEQISIMRDYDSVLGIHQDIVVTSGLAVSPVARREDTLSINIHLSHHFTTGNVSSIVRGHDH
jgi:hypothetical protein